MEEEGRVRKGETAALLDRVEELEVARTQVERKLEEVGETEKAVVEIRKEVERERSKWSKALGEMEGRLMAKMDGLGGREDNGGGGRGVNNGGGERRRNSGGEERRKKKCVVITDSNGREATEEGIKQQIPRDEREQYDIEVVTAYTLEEAFFRVARDEIEVGGAIVVMDNLTNDVRGTRSRRAATPQELVDRVGKLRETMRGAAAIVTCAVKPMRDINVTQHNNLLSDFLHAHGGYGCNTQIRREFLKDDGFHIRPQFTPVLNKTYACAIRGIDVPCPTPSEDFMPIKDWPYLGGNRGPVSGRESWGWEGQNRVHGWGW